MDAQKPTAKLHWREIALVSVFGLLLIAGIGSTVGCLSEQRGYSLVALIFFFLPVGVLILFLLACMMPKSARRSPLLILSGLLCAPLLYLVISVPSVPQIYGRAMMVFISEPCKANLMLSSFFNNSLNNGYPKGKRR